MSEIVLEVEDLHTYIGQHHILQGVSLRVKRDAVTVLLGRNGAGKTTTMRSIIGLLHPAAGGAAPGPRGGAAAPPRRRGRRAAARPPAGRGLFLPPRGGGGNPPLPL